MLGQSLDQRSHSVNIADDALDDFIEAVGHTEVQWRYEHHVWLLQLEFGFEQRRLRVFGVRELQQVVQRAVDRVEEAVQHHVVQVVHVRTPDVGRGVCLEQN